jgi:hypothetical protein
MSAAARTPPNVLAQQRRSPADGPPAGDAQLRRLSAPAEPGETYGALGTLSIVAGMLHAKAMVDHATHYWPFGVFFGLLTCWQTAWGVGACRARLHRPALVAGAWVNAGVVLLWLISRTVGLPIGPWAGEPEAVGMIDIMASLDELLIVAMVASLVSAVRRPAFAWLRGGYAVRLGIMLSTVSLFALTIGGHTH